MKSSVGDDSESLKLEANNTGFSDTLGDIKRLQEARLAKIFHEPSNYGSSKAAGLTFIFVTDMISSFSNKMEQRFVFRTSLRTLI